MSSPTEPDRGDNDEESKVKAESETDQEVVTNDEESKTEEETPPATGELDLDTTEDEMDEGVKPWMKEYNPSMRSILDTSALNNAKPDDYYIELFFQYRYFKHRVRTRSIPTASESIAESWEAFVESYRESPSDWMKKFDKAEKKFEFNTLEGAKYRVHRLCKLAHIHCAVPVEYLCQLCGDEDMKTQGCELTIDPRNIGILVALQVLEERWKNKTIATQARSDLSCATTADQARMKVIEMNVAKILSNQSGLHLFLNSQVQNIYKVETTVAAAVNSLAEDKETAVKNATKLIRRENESLAASVQSLQRDNADLKSKIIALQAEVRLSNDLQMKILNEIRSLKRERESEQEVNKRIDERMSKHLCP